MNKYSIFLKHQLSLDELSIYLVGMASKLSTNADGIPPITKIIQAIKINT